MNKNNYKQINSMKDIKSGYLCKLRNGHLYMCMRCEQNNFDKVLVSLDHSCIYTSYYNRDLKNCGDIILGSQKQLDIMEVYGLSKYGSMALKFSIENRPLLYKREEAKKLTVKEISEILGYKVEIIEG